VSCGVYLMSRLPYNFHLAVVAAARGTRKREQSKDRRSSRRRLDQLSY